MRLSYALLLPGLLFSPAALTANLSTSATVWHPLVMDVAGPTTSETDLSPHPFLDYRLDVTFTSPNGNAFDVPGFFAGNGRGHGQGSIWRVRFTPDEPGEWRWSVAFEQGENIAVAEKDDVAGVTPVGEHGAFGTVLVAQRDPASHGLLAQGRIDSVAEHYLKQADGDYWINGGINGPEDFFGYAGFDNTLDPPAGRVTAQPESSLHLYAAHVDDWRRGDPDFISTSSGVSSHGIIGTINFLAAQSINSINVLPMNLGAGGANTYPFIDATGTPFANTRYDVSKLHQWNLVLNHMQEKGVAAHIILAQHSMANREWLDQGTLGPQRKLFLREMLARFSYLNGVKWTLSNERSDNTDLDLGIADYLRSLDWAEHPIAVHVNADPLNAERVNADRVNTGLDSFAAYTLFDNASVQSTAATAEQAIETWREHSVSADIHRVIDSTPTGPAMTLDDDGIEELRRRVLYPIYFSGANLEGVNHLLPIPGDTMQAEDFRRLEPVYRYMRVTRTFLQENVPIERALPADTRLSGGLEGDQLFGIADEIYAAWFGDGRGDRRILAGSDISAQWELQWFNPLTGSATGAPVIRVGNQFGTGSAPGETSQDWMLIAKRLPAPAIAAATAPNTAAMDDRGGGAAGLTLVLLIVVSALSKMQLWQRSVRPASKPVTRCSITPCPQNGTSSS